MEPSETTLQRNSKRADNYVSFLFLKRLFLNDRFILSLILINSVILFSAGYIQSENDKLLWSFFDNLITTFFIIELIIKFREFGLPRFFESNWNKFDSILILLSIPSLLAFLFSFTTIDLSFLLVFRVMRVFKAFRFFKFIPDFDQLINGIQRALKTSVFIVIGFIIYIFIIGLLSFYLFQTSDSEYFSNPLISLYSVFKIFTIEGWFEIPEMVTANYSAMASFFTYLYFIAVVLTGGVFGLSLVNSIFVDSMVSDNNDELEAKIDNLELLLMR
jgi:voltage-gated sodium channel